jgi:hypothetical protein
MSSANFDPTEFFDAEINPSQASPMPASMPSPVPASGTGKTAPSQEEINGKVLEAQKKLAELKRVQEELERQKASLEETRRRQMELQTGRQEIIQNLTRGTGLLEEAEFAARRDAEAMAKTLEDFKAALAKLQLIHEEGWTKDNFDVELTRALTCIENARMEWNAARLKFPVLAPNHHSSSEKQGHKREDFHLSQHSFAQLCRLGFALTWPLAAVVLLALLVLVMVVKH